MKIVGLDIGGTKCAVSLGETDGKGAAQILKKQTFPTPSDPWETLKRLADAVRANGTDGIEAIGISCGGPLDSRKGVILSPPNLKGWDNIPIVDTFAKEFGVPVHLQNDANACAMAEWSFGAGYGCQNMIFLTFGTGLGAGLILNGKLYSGTNDMAGEAGHIRLERFGPVGYGKAGSFEGFCSGSGLAQLGKMRADEALQQGKPLAFARTQAEADALTAKTIAQAADAGDADAAEIYRLCGEQLGHGLSVLVDLLNPERIVIGSIFTRSRHLLRDACEKVMRAECLPLSYAVCSVLPAALGEQIGDYAALAVALG